VPTSEAAPAWDALGPEELLEALESAGRVATSSAGTRDELVLRCLAAGLSVRKVATAAGLESTKVWRMGRRAET